MKAYMVTVKSYAKNGQGEQPVVLYYSKIENARPRNAVLKSNSVAEIERTGDVLKFGKEIWVETYYSKSKEPSKVVTTIEQITIL